MVWFLAPHCLAAQITLSNLTHTYNGNPKSATVTTDPAGLNYTITYAGSPTPPTNAGSYAVVATIDDPVETGSASGTLVINKANQTITMPPLPAKTYGDPPFIATATSNVGLPVTKWQSSDPAVATISPAGEITLTGAGQTSIIADFNPNYNPAWRAIPLNVARSEALQPSGTETVIYDGNPHGVDPASLPAGLATETTYRNTSTPEAPAIPEVVFQNGPDTLALSYASTGVQATGLWGQAKYADLGGTARKLHSCDVTLVTWAGYYGGKDNDPTYRFKEWADVNPDLVVLPTPEISIPGNSGGYYHPVTLAFYDYDTVGGTESYRLLTSKTVQAFIPWRPEKLADGSDFPNFGYAFRVPFDFPDGVILPEQVWVAVSFNTQSSGVAPIGTLPGGVNAPYNALNISSPSGQQAGSTVAATKHFFFKDWRWQEALQTRGPMLRLRTVPTNATLEPPVNAGTYELITQAAAFGAEGVSSSMLEIGKAAVEISLSDLTQIRDGNPKPVTVGTVPEGLATHVVYGEDASPDAPSALGSHAVTATSADSNYEGEAQGVLRIGDTFASWRAAVFENSGLPPEDTSLHADADRDGYSNFLEYAANLNPVGGNHPPPSEFEKDGETLVFTYRRNVHALDLGYTIQHTTNLADPSAWAPATPLQTTIIADDDDIRLIEAIFEKPADEPVYFMRLQIAVP